MWLTKFLDIISSHTAINPLRGIEDALVRLNPEKIYVENVRSVLGVSHRRALGICETAVRKGVFKRGIEVVCPDGTVALSTEAESELPDTIRWWKREDGDYEEIRLPTESLQKVVFYRLDGRAPPSPRRKNGSRTRSGSATRSFTGWWRIRSVYYCPRDQRAQTNGGKMKEPEQKKEVAPLPLKEAGFAFVPQTYQELLGFAAKIAATEFVPKAFQNRPEAVMAAWQTGKEVGLPPMASLQSIAIINGRPSIHSNGYWALVTSHPLCEWFTELPPHEALKAGYGECTIKRRGNPHPIVRRFTLEEAKTAKLLDKDNWKQYPGDMLQNRARHRAGDDAIPEATHGLMPDVVAREIPAEDVTYVGNDREIQQPKRASETAAAQTEPEKPAEATETGELFKGKQEEREIGQEG